MVMAMSGQSDGVEEYPASPSITDVELHSQSPDQEPPIDKSELVGLIAELNIGDEYFWNPERLVHFEHWVGHIPIAFWLMKVLQPRCYVELGTHHGNLYCAMCQAVAALRFYSMGYAVDTWQGDIHMAFEEGILEELRTYHDPRYGGFSKLLPMTFDQAAASFAAQNIDLLHIDGTHTYETVRHDFEIWLPKLSSRGVVLFHDTNVRRDDFGVWRLWNELTTRYPAFNFLHSYGLGVLGVGTEQPAPLRALFDMTSNPRAAARVRALFASRGDALVLQARYRAALENPGQREGSGFGQAAPEWAVARTEAELRERALHAQTAIEVNAVRAEAERRVSAIRAQSAAELRAVKVEAEQRESAFRAQAAGELGAAIARAEQREQLIRDQVAAELKGAIARAQREITLRAQAMEQLKAAVAKAEQCQRANEALARAVEAEAARRRAIEQSTMWKALYPFREFLCHLPSGARRFCRRLLRMG
jgi:hypothetical protein